MDRAEWLEEMRRRVEVSYQEEFDGVVCIDALEHVSPEDYPLLLKGFSRALQAGGWLYFTVDNDPSSDLGAAYQRAKAPGLPVVRGELVDAAGYHS